MEHDYIYGRGPVAELLESGQPVEYLLVQNGLEGSVGKLIARAKAAGIPIKTAEPRKLEEISAGANHQGVAALTAAAAYVELSDLLDRADGAPPFLVLADGIEDPHNLGAIIRTAEAAGAHGLVVPKRRSAGLTGVVAKASAGAVVHLPVARVAGIPTAIEQLKQRGIWVYGADMDGTPYDKMDFSGPSALVLGGEGKGLGSLVKQRCDALVSLPMRGKMNSLNVSVAAGILLYEMAKHRTND